MYVACLCPLPVGIVRWHAPLPTTTVIVKATFALESGEGLREVQHGLDRDDAGAVGTEEELERASDFAPRKPRADVLLVGHARAPKACEAWVASVEVDGWSKRFMAFCEEPSASVPLLSAFLRSDAGKPVRVGPRPMEVPGWQTRRVSADFDFGRFNVAPGDQRLARLSPRCRMVLRGLVGDGEPRIVELPGLLPSLYCVASRERGAPAQPVPLGCDTLWIHTDLGVCTLTWRGEVAQPGPESFLVIDAAYGIPPGWSVMSARLGDAVWIQAVDEHDITGTPTHDETTSAEGMPTSGPTQVRSGEPVTDELDEDKEEESDHTQPLTDLVRGPAVAQSVGSAPRRPSRTMKGVKLPLEPALPFRNPEPGALPPRLAARAEALGSASARETRAIDDDVPQRAALPFDAPQSAIHETVDEPTGPLSPAQMLRSPLPFAPVSQPISEVTPMRYQPDSETRAHRHFPAPSAPAPAAPPPATHAEVPERWDSGCMPLDRYADIKVAILSGKRTVTEILDAHSLDEVRWREEERKRAEALSRAAKAGDGSAVLDLRRAMRAAMRRREQG